MTTAWLMLAEGDERQHGGNDGYDDDPERHYGWDDTVHNHRAPAKHHAIVLWNKHVVLGASVIESIDEEDSTKVRLRCRDCKKTTLKTRTKGSRYRCYACRAEFNEPLQEQLAIHTYRSNHEPAWVPLDGILDPAAVRQACVQPNSQHSIRELVWDRFTEALGRAGADVQLGILRNDLSRVLHGGHKRATVRVRIGQRKFRLGLIEQFGATCAFTGRQHAAVLDAAHLYRYAEVGRHHNDGGLLLRKDLHRLFDLGLIAVNPDSTTVDVHPELLVFPHYAALNGRALAIATPRGMRSWLALHWQQHRSGEPAP